MIVSRNFGRINVNLTPREAENLSALLAEFAYEYSLYDNWDECTRLACSLVNALDSGKDRVVNPEPYGDAET